MFLDYPERPRAPPPASVQLSGLEQEPLLLPWDLRLTPEQFERVCQANPESLLELAADGAVIAMTPTGGETGSRNSRLLIQLGMALGRGQPSLRIFDSSTGFLLPDGSVLRPDLVIELASTSDEGRRGVAALRRKMDLYQANGVRLGWLLLPHEQAVEIWRCGQLGMGERQENASRLDGSELAEGLGLDLDEIWVV
jgi:Uma2 family endonuclease